MPSSKKRYGFNPEVFSTASGNKCKKAPPNKAPVEKATRKSEIFRNLLSLIEKPTTPTKENRLIIKVAIMEYNKVLFKCSPFSILAHKEVRKKINR